MSTNPNEPPTGRSYEQLQRAARVLAEYNGAANAHDAADFYVIGGRGATGDEIPAEGMLFRGEHVWLNPPMPRHRYLQSNQRSETLDDGTIVLNPFNFRTSDPDVVRLAGHRLFYNGIIWYEEGEEMVEMEEEEEFGLEDYDNNNDSDSSSDEEMEGGGLNWGPPPAILIARRTFEERGMVYLLDSEGEEGDWHILPSEAQINGEDSDY